MLRFAKNDANIGMTPKCNVHPERLDASKGENSRKAGMAALKHDVGAQRTVNVIREYLQSKKYRLRKRKEPCQKND